MNEKRDGSLLGEPYVVTFGSMTCKGQGSLSRLADSRSRQDHKLTVNIAHSGVRPHIQRFGGLEFSGAESFTKFFGAEPFGKGWQECTPRQK